MIFGIKRVITDITFFFFTFFWQDWFISLVFQLLLKTFNQGFFFIKRLLLWFYFVCHLLDNLFLFSEFSAQCSAFLKFLKLFVYSKFFNWKPLWLDEHMETFMNNLYHFSALLHSCQCNPCSIHSNPFLAFWFRRFAFVLANAWNMSHIIWFVYQYYHMSSVSGRPSSFY